MYGENPKFEIGPKWGIRERRPLISREVTDAHERFFNQLAMKLHSEFERLDVILGGTLPGLHFTNYSRQANIGNMFGPFFVKHVVNNFAKLPLLKQHL